MAWFDRLRGEMDVEAARARLDQAVDAAGLPAVLAAASGRVGLRRYLVHFEERGGRLRIVGMDAPQLPRGGGPPDASAFDASAGAIERALATLRAKMPRPFVFTRGAVGVVRDGKGELSLHFRFDEDADEASLEDLPTPTGGAVPIEDPAYLRALAAWDGRLAPVRARWLAARPDEDWTLEGGRLRLPDRGGEVHRAEPIATFRPRTGNFAWLVAKPAGEEAPFVEPELEAELGSASTLAVFAAARLGHVGVFQGQVDGDPPTVLFAGLKD